MSLSRQGPGSVATVPSDTTLVEAARHMSMLSVGALVIADAPDAVPTGIVTDRDLVRMIGDGCDPKLETVAAFTRRRLETIGVGESTHKAVALMRRHGVRRLPIVDHEGRLAGIVSLDDVLRVLGEDLADVAETIQREFANEHPLRSAHDRSL